MAAYRFLITIFFAFNILCFNQTANASEQKYVSASEIYQTTETLRLTLEQLNLLDTEAYENEEDDEALRYPRHVMQKTRECHTVIAKILQEHGKEPESLPKLFSVREIRPADVQNAVKHLLEEVSMLSDTPPPQAEFVEGKQPNDVYNNLKRICHSLRYKIVPSDVYIFASAVNQNMEKILESRGYENTTQLETFSGKIPADVYQETKLFLDDLRNLALKPDFSIPGGIILPNEIKQQDIEPQDVIGLMNDAISGTEAIKYALGVREHASIPAYEDGKEPSDVFGQIHQAHQIVKILLEKEAVNYTLQ